MSRAGSRANPGRQTALEGIAVTSIVGGMSRVLFFVRHLALVAVLGAGDRLDMYLVSLAVVSGVFLISSELFDAVVLPRLVTVRESLGPEPEAALARAFILRISKVAVALTGPIAITGAALLLWHVPGLDGRFRLAVNDTILLLPYGLVLLPMQLLGTFHRARRRFHPPLLAELVAAGLSLVLWFPFRDVDASVPLSLSVAYVAAFALLFAWTRSSEGWRAYAGIPTPEPALGAAVPLFPIFAAGQVVLLVDRLFAMSLGEGAVSALWVAFLVANAVPMLTGARSVLMTPYAESGDRSAMLTTTLAVGALLSLPMVGLLVLFPDRILDFLFGRGQFGPRDVEMAAGALRSFAVGVPGLLLWPIFSRVLVVLGHHRALTRLAVVSVIANVAGNSVAVFVFGLGVEGIALATTFVYLSMLGLALGELIRSGLRVDLGGLSTVVGGGLLALSISLVWTAWVPARELPIVVVCCLVGGLYVLVAALLPGSGMSRVRSLVLAPLRARLGGGS